MCVERKTRQSVVYVYSVYVVRGVRGSCHNDDDCLPICKRHPFRSRKPNVRFATAAAAREASEGYDAASGKGYRADIFEGRFAVDHGPSLALGRVFERMPRLGQRHCP